ncbi:MAG: flagellar hook-basal body complex protein FliE [Parvularculaceae bacterium]
MKLLPFEAAAAYGAAKAAMRSGPSETPRGANVAFEAIRALSDAVKESEKQSIGLMTGAADPHSVVEAIAAAELAIETAVTVRDKVVEAYQELLRMPM